MKKYRWHDEPVKVEFGICKVEENKEKPLWWYNFDVAMGKEEIPAVRVTYGEHSFVISNRYGEGEEKLRRGGWPNFPHASLPDDLFSVTGIGFKYDPDGINDWNAKRDKWQKENLSHLDDYKKSQSLKQVILKSRL